MSSRTRAIARNKAIAREREKDAQIARQDATIRMLQGQLHSLGARRASIDGNSVLIKRQPEYAHTSVGTGQGTFAATDDLASLLAQSIG